MRLDKHAFGWWFLNSRWACVILAVVLGVAALTLCANEGPRGSVVLYVDDNASLGGDGSSWATAYAHLQDALSEANSNGAVGEIWVAEGTYLPDLGSAQIPCDRSETFRLIPGVRMYGGFVGDESILDERNFQTHSTVLSGDLNGDDNGFANNTENSVHVVDSSDANSQSLLDGFVIRGGNTFPMSTGGAGLYAEGGAAVFANCSFEWNSAIIGGAAYSMGNTKFVGCRFRWNRTHPSLGGGRPGNQGTGGGFYCGAGCDAVFINCEFQRNAANWAGALCVAQGKTKLTNCTVSGNWSGPTPSSFWSGAAGLYVVGGPPEVGGVDGVLHIENSIIGSNWDVSDDDFGGDVVVGDLDAQLLVGSYAQSIVTNTIIDERPTVNAAPLPLFVETPHARIAPSGEVVFAALGDLRLRSSSPAIDAGNNAADTNITTNGTQAIPSMDINGYARFVDDPDTIDTGVGTPPIVDLGPHEYQPGDCNYNGMLDSDEIAAGTSLDCNDNFVPDDCEPDIDDDGIVDDCDPCAGGPASGDVDANGVIDLNDYISMVPCLTGPFGGAGNGCECFDFDNDGDIDLQDFASFTLLP